MDVRAILLVGAPAEGENGFHVCSETIGGVPIASLDVLGAPVFLRVAEHLGRAGLNSVTVVADLPAEASNLFDRPADVKQIAASGPQQWRTAENVFSELVQSGADAVLVFRVGPYIELNIDDVIQFHCDQRNRVTAIVDRAGLPLDAYVLSASRRNDAAFMFRHHLKALRLPAAPYIFKGYCNRLCDAGDLRRLAVDTFLGRTQIVPAGRQVKPGVWVGEGARIQRGARLLAPAFIGRRVKVRSAVVVTRCSCVEHHSEVDCGTVIDNSTVLPYTYVGAGLDANHTVLGLRRLSHLRRKVEVEVSDPKLVGMVSTSAPMRALASAVSLTSFLPLQVLRGLFSSTSQPEPTPSLPESLNAPEAVLNPDLESSTMGEFSADLAVARRYGDR